MSYKSVVPSLTKPPIYGIYLLGVLPTAPYPYIPSTVAKTESMLGTCISELAFSNDSKSVAKAKEAKPLRDEKSGSYIADVKVRVLFILY